MVNSKIQAAEENLIHVYNRFPIALDHGKGMYLYDTEGKEYLDFAAGFAVCGLGYGNTEFQEALKEQIDKICHISNLYYHETCGEAAKELMKGRSKRRVDMPIQKRQDAMSLSPWTIPFTGAVSAQFP